MLVPYIAGSAAVVVTGSYVAFRAKRVPGGLDSLVPLTPNLSKIISDLDDQPLPEECDGASLSSSELWLTLKNFRSLQTIVDSTRLQDEGRQKEFEAAHRLLAENGRNMTQKLGLAIMEKVSNSLFRTSSQLCATAVVSCYIQEVLLVVNLLKLARNMEYRALEGHLYAV